MPALKRFLTALAILAFVLALGAPARAQETPHVGVPQRDGLSRAQQSKCPPKDSSGKVPPLKDKDGKVLDRDINGDKIPDYLIDRWHWDDGNGNDVTVELWCVSIKDDGYYYSEMIIRSKDTKETTAASPGGAEGGTDPGHC